MSIFSNITSKISQLAQGAIGGEANAADATSATSNVASSVTSAAKAAMGSFDVESALKSLADKVGQGTGEGLDYKNSIVDLLKLLGLDGSLEARQKLADKLGYTGDKSDTSAMNIWLIKQVYAEFSKHGGKLPSGWGH